jgi:hypothetical protein
LNRQKENHYYAPTGTNAPLLANKNDISFSASGAWADNSQGGQIDAAYLAGNHVGIMASYSSLKNDPSSGERGKQKHFEFGAGYVNKLSDLWLFESYGGLGFGKMENFHETGNSTVRTKNYYLQPAIAVNTKNKGFQFGFISKFNVVNFNLGDTTFDNDREPFVTNQMKLIGDNPTHIFWEPGIVLRGGWKEIVFQAGYQISKDLSDKDLQTANGNFSMGVTFRFNTAKKKH